MLEAYIKERLREKEILLMTHIVVGYPDLKTSGDIVKAMVDAGVDLIELQIPFSEPIADGPVIEAANQQALSGGITVEPSLNFAAGAAKAHGIPFLIMSYYNILFRFGVERFASALHKARLAGAIVPDLPPEEGAEYLESMRNRGLDPVMLYAPTTPDERMRLIAEKASGFVYCVARKGVTGLDTAFGAEISEYLARARRATSLPLAVGFGIKDREDVSFLKGKAEIAIIGSEMIRVANERGAAGVGARLKEIVA
ncbi:MAG: tryptophan synthase subunit alpha [Spirochaetales bacterium]|nr:tryptophan synthase subunit alpha [Spirochaetales bacterium]